MTEFKRRELDVVEEKVLFSTERFRPLDIKAMLTEVRMQNRATLVECKVEALVGMAVL